MVGKSRRQALSVLNALNDGRRTLDGILDEVLTNESALSKRDKALFHTLVYGVLRWRNRIDWMINIFSKTSISRIDPKVLNLLRLGLFQIVYLSRVPVSAAVNTSVEMAKTISGPWVVRFVNAVLRRAVREYQQITWPDVTGDPVTALAVTKSFPEWLIKKWLDRFGLKETSAICDAVNNIPPITVRTNLLKTSRDILFASLYEEVKKIELTPYAPDGIRFFNPRISISEMKAFQEGWFQVQDEAAQLVTCFLDPQPGENILDAGAGRGGKTGHIAQLMGNCGSIVALDNDEKKLAQLKAEMKRLGVSIVNTCCHDLRDPVEEKRLKAYDRILIDAPCSGLGVLRRNPDIKWSEFKINLKRYTQKQLSFLDNLVPLVKLEGVLAYAVCSNEPEENEAVVESFLKKHSNFVIDNNHGRLSFEADLFVDQNGYFKTFPHRHHTDGFFCVKLKRIK